VTEVGIKNHAAFIWSVADLFRGDYKQTEYGKFVLPLTVIRRSGHRSVVLVASPGTLGPSARGEPNE